MYDFILVINTNLLLILHRSLHYVIVNDITLKTNALGYISVAESLDIGLSSTTFTQCAPNATDFAEITKITATTPFKVIQGHRFWYKSKAHMRLSISVNSNLPPILHRFRDIAFDRSKIVIFCYPSRV